MAVNDVPISSGIGTYVETLQQSDADQSHRQVMHVGDMAAAILNAIELLTNPLNQDSNSRVRISIENINGALTLSTITTVGTVTTVATVTTVGTVTTVTGVTNLAQLGGFKADNLVLDQMMNTWATVVRGRVQ